MGFYQLNISLGTPIAYQSRGAIYPIALDAILTYLKAARLGFVGEPSLEDVKKGIELPLAKAGTRYPYYKASSLIIPGGSALDYNTWTRHVSWVDNAYHLTKDRAKTFYKQPNAGSGKYRSWMNSLMLIAAEKVTFYFDGDKEQVADLLGDLTHIGVRRVAGFGKVTGFEIIETAQDFSCFDAQGFPQRPIPVEEYEGEVSAEWPRALCGYRPPYYHPFFQTLCYMPFVDKYLPISTRREPVLGRRA